MAEWNQTRDPETREIITCRGTIRLAAATAAGTPFRDWAPPPPPETNNPQRPKILVVGLGPAGCACAAQLRKAFGARVEIRCAEAGRSIGEKSFIRRLGGPNDEVGDADIGAQCLSVDGADPASANVLMDILQHVPGVEHVDDGLRSYGKLARTSERPGGWNAATGQWEHFRVAGGNVNLLRHLLDEAAPDRFSFGRPVLLAAASETSVYDIDDLSCKYDAVVVACGAEASRRCAINLDREGRLASMAKAVGFREVCVRAYASGNASNESDADGVTVSSSSIAVARCGVFVDGEVVARRAGGGAKLYEAVLTPTAPPAAGAKIVETPYVVCSERPLVIVCGDWCAGGGTVDRALASGAAAARFVEERLVVPPEPSASPPSPETVSG